jgi:hypothetical protein
MKTARVTLLLLACAAAPAAALADVGIGIRIAVPDIVVRSQPPPDMAERVPVSPGPGYIWIRGHWAWRNNSWEWTNGHWDPVSQPGQEWIPGGWVERNGGWVWIDWHYTAVSAPQGAQVEVVAPEAPPAAIIETVPVAPGPDYFWISGHWHWNHGWVWLGGHYDRHPHYHEGAGWEAGHWDHRGGNYVWVEGRWR